jgi:hypothetical protein
MTGICSYFLCKLVCHSISETDCGDQHQLDQHQRQWRRFCVHAIPGGGGGGGETKKTTTLGMDLMSFAYSHAFAKVRRNSRLNERSAGGDGGCNTRAPGENS